MTWPKLPLQVGSFKIENVKKAIKDIKIFEFYCLGDLPLYWHDPKGLVNFFLQETWYHMLAHTRNIFRGRIIKNGNHIARIQI